MSNMPGWMQGAEPLPPTPEAPKKKPLWQRPLGWILGFVALCVFCGVCSMIYSATPQGQAILASSNATTTAAAVAAQATADAPTATTGPTETPGPPTETPPPSATPEPSGTPEPSATSTPLPVGQSRESSAPVGQPITSEDGWVVTVQGIERNATQRLKGYNQFNDDPPPGMEWVIVRFGAIYNGTETTGKLLGPEVRLTGAHGEIYSSGAVVLEQPFEGEAFPGGVLQGERAFLVQQDEGNLIAIFDTGSDSSAWYLAAQEITLPIVPEAAPDPAAAEAGKERNAPANGPVLADNGAQLRVLEANLDAAGAIQAFNQFNDPPGEDMKYIMVKVEAQYLGDNQTFSDASFMWRVVGDKNAIYEPSIVVLEDGYGGEVFRHGKLDGWIAFEVPADEGNWVMIYSGMGTEARFISVPQP